MKRFPVIVGMILLLLLVPAMAADSFRVNGISPSSGPLGSTLSVTITGSGFDSTCVVTMTKCSIKYGGSSGIVRGTIKSFDSNHLYVEFPLSGTGVIVDDYDVKVTRQSFIPDEIAELDQAFKVYKPGGSTTTTSTTTSPGTTATETTVTTSPDGENSVFFETSPSGGEVWLDGNDIGTAAFTYNTNRDGTYDVVIKKTGYEDYAAKVTIIRGQRVHFYAPLTQLEGNSTEPTARPTTGSTVKNVTPSVKSTLKIPTPLGTDPPTPTEESPADPALALGAAAVAAALVVIRRR
jgi:MYXO-CTERM domain-containing protein